MQCRGFTLSELPINGLKPVDSGIRREGLEMYVVKKPGKSEMYRQVRGA